MERIKNFPFYAIGYISLGVAFGDWLLGKPPISLGLAGACFLLQYEVDIWKLRRYQHNLDLRLTLLERRTK